MLRKILALVVAAAALPGVAAGAPALSDGHVGPSAWSRSSTAAATWQQNDFDGENLGPALVQVNAATDGTAHGQWSTRSTVGAPLASGAKAVEFRVADLEGRHRVRVVVDGAENSPLDLGTLQLDRTPPALSDPAIQYVDSVAVVSWHQGDGGPSGIDPQASPRLEVNASPHGDDAGVWTAVTPGPGGGEGRRHVPVDTAGLPEGVHAVRAVVSDRAGNVAARTLGVVYADRRAPGVSVTVTRSPAIDDPVVELQVDAVDPQPGAGVADGAVAQLRSADGLAFFGEAPLSGGRGRLSLRLPGPGLYDLALHIPDRAGRVGRSPAFRVEVPRHVGPVIDPDRRHAVIPEAPLRVRGGEPLGPGARAAWAAARRFHARRGLQLEARPLTARTARAWRAMLGARDAHRYVGYATFGGQVLLGPAVSAGLEDLQRARERMNPRAGSGAAGRSPSRLELDRMAMALGVLLHETLHATGPAAVEDLRDTPSGRGFEEGFTEAVTMDLLPDFTRSLGLPPRLRAPLVAAVTRYRSSSPGHVAWARYVSGLAVGADRNGAAARAFRLRVADTWGADRWTLLSQATGMAEVDLRTGAADPLPARRRR